MASIKIITLVAALSLVAVDGARILAFFPFPSPSHQAVFQSIVRRLAERGHSVTFLSPRPLTDPPPNYKEILVRDTVQELFRKIDLVEMGEKSPLGHGLYIMEMGYLVQEMMCEEKAIQDLLKSNSTFDLILLESLFVQESFIALQHRFRAPSVDVMTCGGFLSSYDAAGSPYNPSYMVDLKSPYTNRMNFAERLMNSVTAYGTSLLNRYYYLPSVQKLMDKCFRYPGWEDRPGIPELLANISLVIHNSHFSLNYAVPHSPHFIETGGIQIKPTKPLPKDIQAFMDEAEDGVILFSLGSILSDSKVVIREMFNAFHATFRKLKQRVIWKLGKHSFTEKADNIYIANWLPLQDILAHKNCRLFITHGGYLSVSESVNFGVPLIGVPFFGDQRKNVKHIASSGYGLQLDFTNITEESISWAINEVLYNPSYKETVLVRSKIFNDRPMSALDTAVYWIEYVIRHKGASHLRPSLAELPWYKAALLDVAIFILAVVLAVVVGSYIVIRKLLRLCRALENTRDTKKSASTKINKYKSN